MWGVGDALGKKLNLGVNQKDSVNIFNGGMCLMELAPNGIWFFLPKGASKCGRSIKRHLD